MRDNFCSTESPDPRILWIGGSPCAGKSAIATSLANQLGYHVYHCDDHWERHAEILSSQSQSFKKIAERSIEDRLRLSIERQVADEFDVYRLEFQLILEDIDRIDGPVIAEAAALLPELLSAHDVAKNEATWIVPTEDFQRRHYERRAWAWDLLRETSNPQFLFDRWMQRDAAFATAVHRQAESLGYRVIVVDGTRPLDVIEHLTAQQFALGERSAH